MCRVRWPVVSRLARGDGLESDGDGANLVQLTSAGWPETAAPRWSPDGSHVVVFHARPEGPGDIFTIPVSGGVAKRVTDNPADEWGATWSPDGRWIYFGSNRTGRFEVWKVRADGSGTAVQVTRNGGVGPTVSPDGRRTYYAKGSELWRVPVEGGDEVRVLDSLTDWSRFVVVDDGIYFTPRRSSSDETQTDFTIEFLNVPAGPDDRPPREASVSGHERLTGWTATPVLAGRSVAHGSHGGRRRPMTSFATASPCDARSARRCSRLGNLHTSALKLCSKHTGTPVGTCATLRYITQIGRRKAGPMSLVHLAMSRYSVTPEFREAIQRQANELVTNELGRCDDEWHSALLSLRETVAALERAYDVIVNRGHTSPSGAVSLHVEGMLETAAEEVERASEHVLAETRLQLGHAQARAERLDAELGVARDELTDTRARLEAERTVRTRVESESADARARYEQALAEREADLRRQASDLEAQRHECATVIQQLAAVRAGNQSLLEVLQTIHGQVGRVMTSVLPAGSEGPGDGHGTSAGSGRARTDGVASEGASARPPVAAPEPVAADPPARHAAPPAAPAAGPGGDPMLASYAATLLDSAETSYREDLESGLVPLDVVERLTFNLRRARDLFAERAGHLQNGHASLFETTVMRLVDTRGGTPFGRHLGIAAYELFSPRAS